MATQNYVQQGLSESHIHDYIMDEYGEEAFAPDGNIKLDTLRDALNNINPEENAQLYNALRLEMSLNDER